MELDAIAAVVAKWATSIPNVKAAYLFGSRVKGINRADSDLDVAIALNGDDDGLEEWISNAGQWCDSLGAMLPMKLDLHMMHSTDTVVMPAVNEHGMQVFERADLWL